MGGTNLNFKASLSNLRPVLRLVEIRGADLSMDLFVLAPAGCCEQGKRVSSIRIGAESSPAFAAVMKKRIHGIRRWRRNCAAADGRDCLYQVGTRMETHREGNKKSAADR